MKRPLEMAAQNMRRSSENVDQRMSLGCEAEDCAFLTPALGSKDYLAMVKHLQVSTDPYHYNKGYDMISIQIQMHTRVVHGISIGAGGGENRECAGFESRSPIRFAIGL